jgi:hypothetical protein
VYVAGDERQLARMCEMVESAAVTLAGVNAAFARGVTRTLRQTVGAGTEIYPVAMYYFIVGEAAVGHQSQRAAANLASAQADGRILRFKNLPAIDREP